MPVIEEMGPEKVVLIITDNASNYGLAREMIIDRFPHIHRTRCVAHGIQLLLKAYHRGKQRLLRYMGRLRT